jgi:hypothetical protein
MTPVFSSAETYQSFSRGKGMRIWASVGKGRKIVKAMMTKPMNRGIFFIMMRIGGLVYHGQGLMLLVALFFGSCTGNSDEKPIVPPETPPLSRGVIGYGVISASYTHVAAEPNSSGISRGYLRRGSIVEVLERRSINLQGTLETWIFVGGSYQGWLREDVIQVYDNEAKARTAAESLTP